MRKLSDYYFCNTKHELILLNFTDTVSTVGGLAATGITIASVAAVPMLPIVATGALITGLGCAAYSVGRSTFKLVRRCLGMSNASEL